MSIAFLFPGQGAQTPGFLHRLPDHPAVAATLAEAGRSLGCDVLSLDSPQALASTVAVQLGIVIAGVAVSRLLAAEGVVPAMVAGLSVGAFSAAVAGGALALADALPLVRLRGELMEKAYPHGYGLAAIVGLNERKVCALIAERFDPAAPVYLANLNAPGQFVIAGAEAGLEAVLAAARAGGARKAERMAVSVPSHCPLLAGVATALGEALEGIPVAAPAVDYIDNRHARPTREADRVKADLASNVMFPVHWHDGTVVMFERGARLFLEMAPGHVLSSLAAAAFEEARAVTVDETMTETDVVLADREGDLDRRRRSAERSDALPRKRAGEFIG